MKSMTILLLLLAGVVTGTPGLAGAQAPLLDASEKAQLTALNQPSLLAQSAGDRILIVDDQRGWRRHRVYISAGAIILTAVIVTLVVLGGGIGGPRRY